MKRGIFGGTFNPVHCGHVRLARRYMEAASLDTLTIIPTLIPPHKRVLDLVGAQNRFEMCQLAFASISNCQVSDLELQRPDKSYTVDTLEQLSKQYPVDSLCLLMGSDMFFSITEWKSWRRIFSLATLCVGARETDLTGRIETEKQRLEQLGANCEIVHLEPMPLSSTEVRKLVVAGKSISGLVPESVEDYIVKNNLYR